MPQQTKSTYTKSNSVYVPRFRQLQHERNPPMNSPPENDEHINQWFHHIKSRVNVDKYVFEQIDLKNMN